MIRSIPSYRLVGQIKYVAIEECCLALLYCNFCFCVTKVGYRNKLICKNNNGSINFYDNFIKLLQIYHARVFQYKSESLVIHFKLQCKNYAIFIWSRVSRKLERKLLLQLVGTRAHWAKIKGLMDIEIFYIMLHGWVMTFVIIPSLIQTITRFNIVFIYIFWEICNWKILYWLHFVSLRATETLFTSKLDRIWKRI